MRIVEAIQRRLGRERLRKLVLFGLVGGFGTVLNTAILYALTAFAGLYYLLAAAIATESAIISNFIGNHLLTFRHDRDDTPLWRRFLSFQAISLITLVGTLVILWTLTTLLGERLLLVWNLVAILLMFLANFGLNWKFTWKGGAARQERTGRPPPGGARRGKLPLLIILLLPALLVFSPSVHAEDIVAASQFGYHPLSEKQVVVYVVSTNATGGDFTVNGPQTFNGLLTVPVDGNTNPTTCQGGVACLVGDFTNLTAPGIYTLTATAGGQSHTTAQLLISPDIYANNLPVFFEFFDAARQQGSDYHADMHGAESPALPTIADGSYILQADQAALTAVRLSSAYRRDPAIFDDTMRAHIIDYVDYLLGIRGAHAVVGQGPYRFGWEMSPQDAFVPGPTNLTELQLYDSAGNPSQIVNNVTSLCGENNYTGWQSCVDRAAQLYQCAVDEPCLNLTYVGPGGTVQITSGDHTYPAGWMYDWNCFIDARLQSGMFNDAPDPCLMFDETRGGDMYTILAFAAFTQAIPAIYDRDPAKATAVYNEVKAIAAGIGDTFANTNINTLAGPKNMTAAQKYAWAGMGLFLLYDYSGDASYLVRAHGYRGQIATDFNSASTFGNEYYWEEYIRHEGAIRDANLTYEVGGNDPRSYFTGKMYYDWENNDPIDISRSGERVFQKMRSSGFSNSRSQLIEAVYAMKAVELASATAPPYTQGIADSQLAWLTGQNAVQDGETGSAPLRSYSFIFGLGRDNPTQYHSRYLIDTSLYANSGGSLLGARGIDYKFMLNGTLSWMDGRSEILGGAFGALGNDVGPKINPWLANRTYANGKTFIPGWINGAFDTNTTDGDVILNYFDNKEAYLFTETTNEMVATAVELFAYMDGQYNNRSRHAAIIFNDPNATLNATLTVLSSPVNGLITLNGTPSGSTPQTFSLAPGTYTVNVTADNYNPNSTVVTLTPNSSTTINLTLTPIVINGTGNLTILGSGTDLQQEQNSTNYHLFETDTGTFWVNLSAPATVQWFYVDGNLTQNGTNIFFSWTPGILTVPRPPNYYNTQQFLVTAVTPAGNVTWDVDVEDVINPFLLNDVFGAADATPTVVTNNKRVSFSNVSVILENGGSQTTYQLDPIVFGNETEWKAYIGSMPSGTTYLRTIICYDNATNTTKTYTLGNDRAHYRSTSSSNNGGQGDGGGGGGGGSLDEGLALVYVTLSPDIIGVQDNETITLDAKAKNGAVQRVEAAFQTPKGTTRTEELTLIRGDGSYGTWSATFRGGFVPGSFRLRTITLWGGANKPKAFNVTDRSFFVLGGVGSVGEEGAGGPPLALIFTVLNASQVQNGSSATLRLDARDSVGITSVTAEITTSRNDSFILNLRRVAGTPQYGTWEGVITATEPDTTYRVSEITLFSGKESKSYPIVDRSVYVEAAPADGGFGLVTGAVAAQVSAFSRDAIARMLAEPMVPIVVGFGIMVIVLTALYLNRRVKRLQKSDER